jgi:hypothetical protein
LKLAADTNSALTLGRNLVEKLAKRDGRRLWFPKLTREWFGSNAGIMEYDANDFNVEEFGE